MDELERLVQAVGRRGLSEEGDAFSEIRLAPFREGVADGDPATSTAMRPSRRIIELSGSRLILPARVKSDA